MPTDEQAVQDFIDSIDPSEMRDGTRLREVAAARDAVGAAQQRLQDAVTAARKRGDSWTMIGLMLGVSRQAAQKRFG